MPGYVKKGYKRKIDLPKAIELLHSGHCCKQIALHFGASRQAVYQSFEKAGVNARAVLAGIPRPAPTRDEIEAIWRNINYVAVSGETKQAVRSLTQKAIRDGLLKPQPCEVCGSTGRLPNGQRGIQAHHDDYSQPYHVRWLCQKHHREWHSRHQPTFRGVRC